ncbi:TetR/AcrR family transcriptional regulator [Ferrimonas pelagia]|uniref:HTH tetR-type domain-containing protein n=1 Tax=Ferrimonas pelagia TaxID=1177826 RepID=A0ABP9EY17_9GAMM
MSDERASLYKSKSDKHLKLISKVTRSVPPLIRQKGLANFSLSDVIKASGVPRTVFYRLFSSKDDVLAHTYLSLVLDRIELTREVVSSFGGGHRDKIVLFYCVKLLSKPTRCLIDSGLNFYPSNKNLWNNANEEILSEIRCALLTLRNFNVSLFTMAIDSGDLSESKEDVRDIIHDMMIFELGYIAYISSRDLLRSNSDLKELEVFNKLFDAIGAYAWAGCSDKGSVELYEEVMGMLSLSER